MTESPRTQTICDIQQHVRVAAVLCYLLLVPLKYPNTAHQSHVYSYSGKKTLNFDYFHDFEYTMSDKKKQTNKKQTNKKKTKTKQKNKKTLQGVFINEKNRPF